MFYVNVNVNVKGASIMKRKRMIVLLVIAVMVILGSFSCTRRDTKEMWAKAAEAQKKGLPQSAIAELQRIHPIAIANRSYAEGCVACCWVVPINER